MKPQKNKEAAEAPPSTPKSPREEHQTEPDPLANHFLKASAVHGISASDAADIWKAALEMAKASTIEEAVAISIRWASQWVDCTYSDLYLLSVESRPFARAVLHEPETGRPGTLDPATLNALASVVNQISQGQPVRWSSGSIKPCFSPEENHLLRSSQITAFLGIPLTSDEKPLGTIILMDSVPFRQFSDADMEKITALARLASAIIEHLQYQDEQQLRLTRSEEMSRQLRAFQGISRHLTATMTMEQLAGTLAGEMAPISVADWLLFVYPDPDPTTLCIHPFKMSEGRSEREEKQMISLYRSSLGELFQEGETIEMSLSSDKVESLLGLRDDLAGGWLYGIPIRSDLGTQAALVFLRQKDIPFKPTEQQGLRELAELISPAIQNIQLYQELLRSNQHLREVQEHILQSERLRALGEMAGGVAHDFNNSLAAILGNAELALKDLEDEIGIQSRFEIIRQAALDAAETVKRIQDFARAKVNAPFEIFYLEEVTRMALDLTRPRWKDEAQAKGIEIRVHFDMENEVQVRGNPSEIREVLTNLISNAVQAMPTGGDLTFRTGIDHGFALWSITDTGEGIKEEDQPRVFDPFFTTKGREGTGLGLSVSYTIIRRHHGQIRVESEENEGATFMILLPLASGISQTSSYPFLPSLARSLRILVIEDEEIIRSVLQDILEDAGQQVTLAMNGPEGLELTQRDEFDLVITDHGLPGMNGLEVARAIKQRHPRLPVLMLTGWGQTAQLQNDRSVDAVLGKPVPIPQLIATIANLTSKA